MFDKSSQKQERRQLRESPYRHSPRSQLRESNLCPNQMVQSLTERLGFLARLPFVCQKKEPANKPVNDGNELFQNNMNSRIGATLPSDKKEMRIEERQQKTPLRAPMAQREVFSGFQSQKEGEPNFQSRGNFQSQRQTYQQLKSNIAFVEQSLANSRCLPQPPPNKAPSLRPPFESLLLLFNKGSLPSQQKKQAVILFLKWQIQSQLGHKCSQLYTHDDVQIMQQREVGKILMTKVAQAKVLGHIFDAFYFFVAEIGSARQLGENLHLLLQQIWAYFMEFYHHRAQQLLAFCLVYFYQQQKDAQNSGGKKVRMNEFIVQKMEQLNKQAVEVDQNAEWVRLMHGQLEASRYSPHSKRRAFQPREKLSHRPQFQQFATILFPKKAKSERYFVRIKNNLQSDNMCPESISYRKESKLYKVRPFQPLSGLREEQQMIVVRYSVAIQWLKGKEQTCNDYFNQNLPDLGQVRFPSTTTYQALALLLKSEVTKKLTKILRIDAIFQYSKLFQTTMSNNYTINITINQKVVNLPIEYEWEADWNDTFMASKFMISNQYGCAVWQTEINVSKLDFSQQVFKLLNLTVQCNCQQLNKPCVITFYDLPDNIKQSQADRGDIFRKFANFIQRERHAELSYINFEQRTFTVEFSNFDSKQRQIRHSLGAYHFENVAQRDR